MGRLQALVEATPPERARHVDLLRAVAILVVVIGHWLAAVVIREGDLLTHLNALEVLEWSHPITWLLQVMPLFFIVGGYANAASLQSHRGRAGSGVDWLLTRCDRLVRPVTVLLMVLCGGGLVASLFGVSTRQLGIMAHGAVLPLWFLVVYLVVVVLTPPMYALHRRFGMAVLVVLLVLIVAGDLLRFGADTPWAASGNFVFVWLAIHQAGLAWQDRQWGSRARTAVPLVVIGLTVLVLATLIGPYPISMINVPGAEVHNVSPPTLALLALATAQLGVALVLSKAGERWMQRARPWAAVIAINTVTFSMFLWHMTAVVLVALTLDAVGLLPSFTVGSPAWFLWQVPWILMLAAVLTGLLMLFSRAERPGDPSTGVSGWLSGRLFGGRRRAGPGRTASVATVIGLVAAVLGMFLIAEAGPVDHGRVPLPTLGLGIWLAAAATLWLVRLARTDDS